MNTRGHNERSFRLDTLASEAREGLRRVEAGEEETIGGWLAYGLALNEGRALFPGDREFGEWVALSQLATAADGSDILRDDRAAAMWAAANADQFEEARQRGNPRTIRGVHAKWKEIEAERAAEEAAKEAAKRAEEITPKPPEGNEKTAGVSDKEIGQSEGAETLPDAAAVAETPAVGAGDEGGGVAEPPPDPDAKLRREFRALTPEAQEDAYCGQANEIRDLRKRVSSQRSEIADLKAEIKVLTEGDDMGRKLGNLLRERDTLKGRIAEMQATIKRQEYRIRKFEGQEVEV